MVNATLSWLWLQRDLPDTEALLCEQSVSVKCSSASGVPYIGKLNASESGTGLKFIFSDTVWYTLAEFEVVGSKFYWYSELSGI